MADYELPPPKTCATKIIDSIRLVREPASDIYVKLIDGYYAGWPAVSEEVESSVDQMAKITHEISKIR